MEYKLSHLEPKAPLRYFEEISQIPRGSHNEEAICCYLADFAKTHGLVYHTDELYNVVIKKPGQHGGEQIAPLALQGHADMVCEKNNGTDHDFLKDPIPYYADGDLLRAKGTTLGADNGVAVAIMLALLEDGELPHPPLECLFTAQEETGLGGAIGLDADSVDARRMLNLDCGPEGVAVVGSSGGLRVDTAMPARWEAMTGTALCIEIKGLRGGHSGADIHEGRGNANKLMGRVLYALAQKDVRLCEISGGAMDNAIPRECVATVVVPKEALGEVEEILSRIEMDFRTELAEVDREVRVISAPATADRCLDRESTKRMVDYLNLCPSGMQVYSWELAATVTSVNLAVIRTEESGLRVTCSIRSAHDSHVWELRDRLQMLAELAGGTMKWGSHYPGWAYQVESPLRELAKAVYHSFSGEELQTQVIHGGLECGVFKNKWPEMDIVAMSSDLDGAHSPEERMPISSFDRFYRYVRVLLQEMCK